MDEVMTLWPSLTEAQQAAVVGMVRACAFTKPAQPFEWLTVKEAAEQFGISQQTLYSAIRAGRLEARLPHGQSRGMHVSRAEMERWTGMRKY